MEKILNMNYVELWDDFGKMPNWLDYLALDEICEFDSNIVSYLTDTARTAKNIEQLRKEVPEQLEKVRKSGVSEEKIKELEEQFKEDYKDNIKIIVKGFTHIWGYHVEENLPKFKLPIKAIIIPEEFTEKVRGIDLDLEYACKTDFRAKPVVEEGKSYVVSTGNLKGPERTGRFDYVISAQHPKLYEIIDALDLPNDLIIEK